MINMFKRGEVYYVDLPVGIGSEQSGKRPAVIIQNDTGNEFSPTLIMATITSAYKKYIPTHLNIFIDRPSIVLCEQLITVSKQRLMNKIGELSEEVMVKLDEKLKISLGLR